MIDIKLNKHQLLYLRKVLLNHMSEERYINNDMVDDVLRIITDGVGEKAIEYGYYLERLMSENNGVLDESDPISIEISRRYKSIMGDNI